MNIAYIYILLKCVPFSNPREYSKIGDLTLTTLFWSPSPYSHLVTCKKGCHSVQRWWACSGLCTTFILGATIVSFWRESIRVKYFIQGRRKHLPHHIIEEGISTPTHPNAPTAAKLESVHQNRTHYSKFSSATYNSRKERSQKKTP